ncbi:carbon-monoxide dehydrogenase small subunit [Paenibacillus sp. SORGH_AS306]|uniref:(2Fe-2S)-binding protein n=1 Tax=unclassified Paenibacillus TaxID=185978 RepID=UPI00278AAA8F|nr:MULTISPECIES: (2Fe-2S)-binding protein [unclassified Paenibacillus]MDQ1233592.1 carbon-monoxide dehydrogenase small subunit [Paenibacillus sp. SORGH_AS_0306]MDR6110634.1 carbon-monoxide dehydrogenase small subunit [Paenibacillus sp. SORGH_AS_0338]
MKTTDTTWQATVNGEHRELDIDPSRRLVDVIRGDLNLTGTKVSCEIGRCGACMVMINGEPVNSCLTMAYQCAGKEITTIEGLHGESKEQLHPIQEAFLEEGGFQCGYCTPGMIISTKALLDQTPHPNDDEIKEGLCGNLCRCTGYGGIMRAVQSAATKCQQQQQELSDTSHIVR